MIFNFFFFFVSDISKWSASQWNKALPLIKKMSSTIELRIIDKTVFQNMLEEFGAITSWSNEQVGVLMEKAKEVYGKGMF